jgi:hypothetical protein
VADVRESGISPRLLGPDDAPAFLDLIQSAFPRWPAVETDATPLEHLRWKLGSAGTGGPSLGLEQGGRLVAASVCLALRTKVRGEEILCRAPVDVAVRSELQGRGLYGRLRREFTPELLDPYHDMQVSVTRHEAVANVAQRRVLRRPLANRIEVLAGPLSSPLAAGGLSARSLARSAGLAGLSLLNRVRHAIPRGPRPAGIEIFDVSRFDDRADSLWEEASRQFDFALARDQGYLNWRYCDARAGRFHVRGAGADGALLGYAVGRVTGGRGYVADLLALPGRLDVAAALLADVVALLRGLGVTLAEVWLPRRHPYGRLVRRAGFVRVRALETVFEPLRIADEQVAFLDDPEARIHFTAGDTDLI